MKKALSYLAAFLLVLSVPLNINAQVNCETSCRHYATGCDVTFRQTITSWSFTMSCDDGFQGDDHGSGEYTGTICGGVEPCTVIQSL